LHYTYDNDNRIIGVGGTYARTNLPATATATYTATNQVQSWNAGTAVQDEASNLTKNPQNNALYTWDARNNAKDLHSEQKLQLRRNGAAGQVDNLVADHGHVMHLFLVRTPELDRILHLHPERATHGTFEATLPAVEPGKYQVFADTVGQYGFPWTLVGVI